MTRDRERIAITLDELRVYWEAHPDLRLTQLLSNIGAIAGYPGSDLYYLEDDTILHHLTDLNLVYKVEATCKGMVSQEMVDNLFKEDITQLIQEKGGVEASKAAELAEEVFANVQRWYYPGE